MILIAIVFILLGPVIFFLNRPSSSAGLAKYQHLLLRSAQKLSFLVLILTIAGGLLACLSDHILFHDETSILAIAAAFRHGQPLYPASSAPVEYALLYGPATYLLYLPSIFSGVMHIGFYQAWSILPLALATLLIYLTFRRLLPARQQALAVITLFALFLSPLIPSVWSIKADVWILLFAASGLWAAIALPRWPAAVVIALSGAILVDLKFPLILLALIPCLILWQRSERTAALASAFLLTPISLAPFALPGISLPGYLTQLQHAAHHGFSLTVFFVDLPYFFFLLIPTVALFWSAHTQSLRLSKAWVRQNAALILLVSAVLLTALVTGSKKGAGPWHGFAVIVPLLYLNVGLYRLISYRIPTSVLAFAVITLVFAPFTLLHAIQSRLHGFSLDSPASPRAAERELLSLIQQHPHQTLQIGVADLNTYSLTFIRPLLQISGEPLLLDPNARNESDLISEPVSPAVLRAIDTCSVDLFLIPKGGAPFSMPSLYSVDHSIPPQPLYPKSFQHSFLAHYRRLPTDTHYFEIWGCR